MQSVSNNSFKEAINNEYYKKIMSKVCSENLRGVCTKDEIKSIMMTTLLGCMQKYDNTKNVKFSSYLYTSIQNNTRRIYNKKSRDFKNQEFIDNYHSLKDCDLESKEQARDILMSLKDLNPDLYNIVVQKFYYGMTNKEIGEANGYGKEAARKKLKKALQLCREIVYS